MSKSSEIAAMRLREQELLEAMAQQTELNVANGSPCGTGWADNRDVRRTRLGLDTVLAFLATVWLTGLFVALVIAELTW